ncbi:MAG: peroxiredoxin [Thermoprotei archaeon]
MVDLNAQAPDVQLVDTDLKPVKISDFRGKPVVLAFYPGAFTSVCTKEMCTFRDNISKFNSLSAVVVGISVDPPFSNAAFKKSNNLNFPILSDYNREAVKLYGVAAENFAGLKGYTAAKRAVFILDKQGVVRYKWVSDDPRIEPNYDEIAREASKLK